MGDAGTEINVDLERREVGKAVKFLLSASPRPPSGSEVWTRREPPRLQLPHRVPAS